MVIDDWRIFPSRLVRVTSVTWTRLTVSAPKWSSYATIAATLLSASKALTEVFCSYLAPNRSFCRGTGPRVEFDGAKLERAEVEIPRQARPGDFGG